MFDLVRVEELPYTWRYLSVVFALSAIACLAWCQDDLELYETDEGRIRYFKIAFHLVMGLVLAVLFWVFYHFWLGGTISNIVNWLSLPGILLSLPLGVTLVVMPKHRPRAFWIILAFSAWLFIAWLALRLGMDSGDVLMIWVLTIILVGGFLKPTRLD